MLTKKKFSLVLIVILFVTCLFCGCKPSGEEKNELAVGKAVRLIDGVTPDYDNMFFDGFENGVSYDDWYIGKQAWGSAANGGVIPENVNYTDEGVLVISGNGNYYTANDVTGAGTIKDGSLSGGALISKFVTGPGRYQVKMKVLPRLGACTAFWTYCYETETGGNHEIDIELPGGKDHSGTISFENVLNTNYITVEMNESQDVSMTAVTGSSSPVALNDGEWHTFGFDWYTNPEKVVYYIDGVVTAISDTFVPYVQARLWLGVWFPNNAGFVGNAYFQSDAMYVDYVSYIPFLEQPCQQYNPLISSSQVASQDEYPSAPLSVTVVNKVSNGDFEYIIKDKSRDCGWQIKKRNLTADERAVLEQAEKARLTAENPSLTATEINQLVRQYINGVLDGDEQTMVNLAENIGYDDSCGVCVNQIGRFLQEIDSVYEGFDLTLSVKAKGKGKVTLQFQMFGAKKISDVVIEVDGDNWKEYSISAIAPKDTQQVSIIVTSDYGESIFVDDLILHIN